MSVTLRQFIRSLSDSGLMTADEVEAFLHALPRDRKPANAGDLAKELYHHKRLTKFQAQALYQGKTRGLVLGNYVVLEKLGRGGMGQVYKARHRLMKRVVALKVLPSAATRSKRAVKRFRREAEAAARLSHPNIVTAHDADEAEGVPFLVMECVEGKDLAALVRSRGPLSVAQAIDYVLQAARGLEYAHTRNVIHRDIKPSNLLLTSEGTVKILDMGLARINEVVGPTDSTPEESMTATGKVLGTVDYMPPEQAHSAKSVDQRADVYSLGCTLFYLLTGRTVYHGDSVVSSLLAHREAPIPALRDQRDDVPEKLDDVFQKMVAKDPEDRHVSMGDLISELEDCAAASCSQFQPTVAIGGGSPAVQTQETLEAGGTPADVPLRLDLPIVSPVDEFLCSHPTSARGRVIAGSVVVAAAFLVLLLFGVILTLRTRDGTLIVEINELDATVEVLDSQGKVQITGHNDNERISIELDPGKYRLKVTKDGLQFFTQEFTIEAGGTERIKAWLRPLPADRDRQAAKWVLGIGGTVGVSANGQELDVKVDAELPQHTFRVVGIHLPGIPAVSDESLENVTGLTELRKLSLSYTQVSDAGLRNLEGLTKLGWLWLAATKVSDAGLQHLKELRSLQVLVVYDTQVSDAGLKHLKGLTALQHLNLSGTQVTDAGLEQLNEFANLTELELSRTRVTATGVERLQAALPNCTITWKPEPKDTPHDGPDRQAAEWALRVGGTLRVSVNGQEREVTAAPELPAGGFRVTATVLSDNAVTDGDLEKLKGLTQLEHLELYRTKVTDVGLQHLQGAKQLKRLLLGGTQVTDEGLKYLEELRGLDHVDLRMTRITDVGLEQLGRLTKLRMLGLSGTQAGDAGLKHLQGSRQLWFLDLSRTQVTDTGLNHLKALTNLAELRLANTRVTDSGLEHLKGFTGLRVLWLSETRIGDAGLKHLTGLANLSELRLWKTRVTGEGLEHVKPLTKLHWLDLADTKVDDAGLQHLKGLANLTELILSGTQVTAAGVAALHAALPNCKIVVNGE